MVMQEETKPKRRLSAILYIDVVGYSRLMDSDPEGTVRRVVDLQNDVILDIVRRYDGRVVRTMGDGALFEFSSAVNAVNGAVEIQRVNAVRQADEAPRRKLVLRVGASLGEIIIDGNDIHGDGVNVAARLEALASPGAVYISGELHRQVRNRVDVAFEYLGHRTLKNIAKPVDVYRYTPVPQSPYARLWQQTAPLLRRARYPFAGIVALAALGGIVWYSDETPEGIVALVAGSERCQARELENVDISAVPDKPSIVIIPFENRTEKRKDYFVDGFTEDLITQLSKNGSLFVVNRNTSFRFKNCDMPPRQAARQLGVQYVLNGAVRAADKSLRINAALTDTRNGDVIWSDHKDGEFRKGDDIFVQQDLLSRGILSAVLSAIPVAAGPTVPALQKRHFAAYDQYLLGRAAARVITPESQKTAFGHFQRVIETAEKLGSRQAIAADPTFAETHAALSVLYQVARTHRWGAAVTGIDNPRQLNVLANRHMAIAQRLSKDRPNPEVLRAAAAQYYRARLHDLAIETADRAIALDPNSADAHGIKGIALVFSGRPDEAIMPIATAQRLDPYNELFLSYEGTARFAQGNFADSAHLKKRAFSRNPRNHIILPHLIAALVRLGEMEEARETLDTMNSLRREENLEPYSYEIAEKRSLYLRTVTTADGRTLPYKARDWYLDALRRLLGTGQRA